MRRLALAAATTLALLVCDGGTAQADPCASVDCGPYAASLHWDIAPWGHPTTGYYVFLTGTQMADVSSSPWAIGGMDCGSAFSLGVEAHDSTGDVSAMYTSVYATPSCGSAPSETSEPVVTGTIATGDVLSTTNGTWSSSPTPTYAYQWQDCATDGTGCSNITGATSSTYTVASGDAGHTIKALVTATNTNGSTTAGAPTVPLVDEFGGSSVDTNVWTVMNQQGDTSNSEIQCYVPANTTEGSGDLTETLTHVSSFTCPAGTPGSTNPLVWQSGALQMKSVNFLYGTITVSAKLAGGAGWPAIWMLGTACQQPNWLTANGASGGFNCPWSSDSANAAEIDLAEMVDATSTTVVRENLFNQDAGVSGAPSGCTWPSIATATTAFHTYELDWSAGSLVWKIDGTTECTTTTGVPSHPMFLIINTAENGGGTTGGTTVVDYAHVSH
jgi:beta-glucanase (GH16 family)